MFLTRDQVDYIARQYINYLKNKITAEQVNNRIQKKLHINIDLTATIKECKKYNIGYHDICKEIARI